ncbi:hypothetical protein QFZ73_004497 [Peribacillus sp. V2I11]|nr:hypothetical protein [Peribacillus sp. V2I11]
MRIEAIIATILIFTTYTRTVMYFYVSFVVFSNIFNIKDYRPFTTALGMIMVFFIDCFSDGPIIRGIQ